MPTRLVRAAVLLPLLAALLSGCAVNPATGHKQITFVSQAREVEMGKENDRAVLAQYGVYSDTTLTDFVQRVGKKLAAVSERPDLDWHFRVIDSPVVNAFALPGGYVYITRGILAALNSEAQLAGVMGHEIGHVTARHTAQQITMSQIASVGLMAGMILNSDIARYGEVLQGSLGLLFLKFSRDDESQADELGIRYAIRAGYDPREIPGTYDMLERLSQREGGGLPSWESTHPDPGDRKVRTSTLSHEAVMLRGESGLIVDEVSYKERLRGLPYGDDPRGGYLVDNHFYHPDLNFELDWPVGWGVENTAAAVTGAAPDGHAFIQLTLEQTDKGPARPANVIDSLATHGRISQVSGAARTINGLDAWVGHVIQSGHGGSESVSLALIDDGKGRFFRIVGAPGVTDAEGRFLNVVESFSRLRDPVTASVTADTLELIAAPGGHTLESILAGQKNLARPFDEISWINNLYVKDTPPKGKLLKIVLRGRSATVG